MIMKRLWVKRKYNALGFREAGVLVKFKNTKWEGWFLFGFIPLYIRQLEVTYQK